MNMIYHNGQIKSDDGVISPRDLGLRGYGVFDTMLAVEGMPVDFSMHFTRLIEHAKILSIRSLPDKDKMHKAVLDTLAYNKQKSGHVCINTLITAGKPSRGLFASAKPETQVIIQTRPVLDKYPPIKAIIAQKTRRNEFSPLSQIKSMNYGDNVLALQEAETENANDAIMLNTRGNIACFTTGNIFALIDRKIFTPPLSEGALPGIIRTKWMGRDEKIKETRLTPQDLQSADAIFMTNALRGIVPITYLGGKKMPEADFKFDTQIHLR